MGPREWFGVGARLFGIWCFVQAVQHLLFYLDVRLGFSPMRDMLGRADASTNPSGYLVYVIGYAIASGILILLADPLTQIAYPLARAESEEEANEEYVAAD